MIKEINFLAEKGRIYEENAKEALFSIARKERWCNICAHVCSKYDGVKFIWYCDGREVNCNGTCPKWEEE